MKRSSKILLYSIIIFIASSAIHYSVSYFFKKDDTFFFIVGVFSAITSIFSGIYTLVQYMNEWAAKK